MSVSEFVCQNLKESDGYSVYVYILGFFFLKCWISFGEKMWLCECPSGVVMILINFLEISL